MTDERLAEQLMALPLADRVDLAQALWQSIDGISGEDSLLQETEALESAVARDEELSSGSVVGLTHDEVMDAARRAIG